MVENFFNINDNLTFTMIKPKFPPTLTSEELMANAVEKFRQTGKLSKTPNAFLAYRMALQKELAVSDYYPNMRDLSTIAGNLWIQEPENVKAKYRRLIHDAKILFDKYCQRVISTEINNKQQQTPSEQNPNEHSPSSLSISSFESQEFEIPSSLHNESIPGNEEFLNLSPVFNQDDSSELELPSPAQSQISLPKDTFYFPQPDLSENFIPFFEDDSCNNPFSPISENNTNFFPILTETSCSPSDMNIENYLPECHTLTTSSNVNSLNMNEILIAQRLSNIVKENLENRIVALEQLVAALILGHNRA
ncbi:hypothetical protein G9A89_004498 [Geosiphon pyriformis]|nr:hypothetical protein G9A89_004498 [Geosiphon pyriformis]